MKWITATVVLVLLTGCTTCRQPEIDTDYVLALRTANNFLEAWCWRRQDAGLVLLSPRLLTSQTEDEWRMAISGVSNPHHQSYEITGGQHLTDGRIQFDVWLYHHYTRQREPGRLRQAPQHIILLKVGDEEWKVDEIPQL